MSVRDRLKYYAQLMRLDKPIGLLLLLWPTLWALWLASVGNPHGKILLIFVAGVILMRSAGCVMNDFADRHFDGQVKRTCERPLVSGKVTSKEALVLAAFLSLLAFALVLLCNVLTITFAILGALFAFVYPFMKRFTHLPQVGLGIAFAWGVPMAFAAEDNTMTFSAWFLFLTAMIWPIMYDTLYAMVDRDDDIKIGVKSTAILFDSKDKLLIGLLQLLLLIMLVIVGFLFKLQKIYYFSLMGVAFLFIYQQWLIQTRDRQNCFRAFLNNHWVGLIIFSGILASYM